MGTNYYCLYVDEDGDVQIVHIGKRSGGWNFCWNFHDNQYYSNLKELILFLANGTIESDYDHDVIDFQEFICMALQWVGRTGELDSVVDTLRVSSSTYFS